MSADQNLGVDQNATGAGRVRAARDGADSDGGLCLVDARPPRYGDTWGTPREVFAALHAEFRFTVDVAALARNAKLPRYWSPVEDGLRRSWAGERVWCNPPYSRIEPWARKAAERAAEVAVLLVPSRTGTAWWHEHGQHADEIRWLRGRLTFEGAKSSFPEDCVLLVWRGRSS